MRLVMATALAAEMKTGKAVSRLINLKQVSMPAAFPVTETGSASWDNRGSKILSANEDRSMAGSALDLPIAVCGAAGQVEIPRFLTALGR